MLLIQVVFAVRTNETEDLQLLEELLAAHPGVYRRSGPGSLKDKPWQDCYTLAHPGRVYVKIDDDVVFVQVA